jgi:FtsP/CotA-like multicopper oxidase with cupredoxin domain
MRNPASILVFTSILMICCPATAENLVDYYELVEKNRPRLLTDSKARLDKPKPGCEFKEIDINKYGLEPFKPPYELESKNGFLEAKLTVKYSDHNIGGCNTHLRTYNNELVGPTMRLKPGDTLRVKLFNDMDRCDPKVPERCGHQEMNQPGNFNVTNFHTHGFHVSPAGNSDNVLLEIEPGVEFDFEIKVPLDHAQGTFWYHAHVHGSTALQVSSGMAGTLIIEGGLDDAQGIAGVKDNLFVFQQVSYDCYGEVESYSSRCPSKIGGFGPGNWKKMKRHTLVNGQLVPTLAMQPGEIQRWRFVHAGVRETIMAHVENNKGAIQGKLLEIAVDGLATGRIDAWKRVELQPGYRSDVLYQAPEKPGVYWLMDGETDETLSLHGTVEAQKQLVKIVVEGESRTMKMPRQSDLANYKAMKDFTAKEIAKLPHTKKAMMFYLGSRQDIPKTPCGSFERRHDDVIFSVNGIPFNHDTVRTLKLNEAEKWTLCTRGLADAHPFHIHVNPFQVSREGPDRKPQNVWRDTLLVRDKKDEEIYTRYEDYIGKFVLHCHILDHEDQGMMELVNIVL